MKLVEAYAKLYSTARNATKSIGIVDRSIYNVNMSWEVRKSTQRIYK